MELTTAFMALAASLIGVLSLSVTLLFLWKVYKRGGRKDLQAAARALRDARPHRLADIAAGLGSLKRQPEPQAPPVEDNEGQKRQPDYFPPPGSPPESTPVNSGPL